MSEATPIERLRRAGLHDALLDLLGIDEDVALREIEAFLAWVEIPRGGSDPAPPARRIGLPPWDAFDKVADIGYRYAVHALDPETVGRLAGGRS